MLPTEVMIRIIGIIVQYPLHFLITRVNHLLDEEQYKVS